MSKSAEEYCAAVRAHLESEFPPTTPPPPVINLVDADWIAAVKVKCPPPSSMQEVDADTNIQDTISIWLTESHYDCVGSIMVNAERRDAAVAAEEAAKRDKAAREVAPLRALIKDVLTEVLVESGLVSLRPVANTKPKLVHPTKRGPGRGKK